MQLSQPIFVKDLPDGNNGFEPIAPGWYPAQIKTIELKETKARTGEFLDIAWTVTGPANTGRLVFDRMNIKNISKVAEEIGLGSLKALLLATGLNGLKNTDELLNKSANIKVVIKEDPGYAPSNEIKAFKAYDPSGAPAPAGFPKGNIPKVTPQATARPSLMNALKKPAPAPVAPPSPVVTPAAVSQELPIVEDAVFVEEVAPAAEALMPATAKAKSPAKPHWMKS